jgi:hypothetical protein
VLDPELTHIVRSTLSAEGLDLEALDVVSVLRGFDVRAGRGKEVVVEMPGYHQLRTTWDGTREDLEYIVEMVALGIADDIKERRGRSPNGGQVLPFRRS